ncbi:MAG: hypothetical protein WB586_14070 [Chthoniobacterales bacterium]
MNYFREAKIDILINETKSTRLPEMMVNGSLLAETRLAGRLALPITCQRNVTR